MSHQKSHLCSFNKPWELTACEMRMQKSFLRTEMRYYQKQFNAKRHQSACSRRKACFLVQTKTPQTRLNGAISMKGNQQKGTP
ncbi:hypothetical protein CEUSTIGMA_g3291.t1 [Chlamydomonas eustigma]|uniref:Uncharacterized protein n=1 Tax=Chlamydomonas eustigma TaxID=1157962 RepID=A0A250WYC0_9CHLO|nr:hypothetical protein CEUSTIGMA_g3291.t1 [Chlamydomonas eustigma]|eukprot:GAX75848.1 hypothetical protein CEUSTIGMA_g3291.t1 [Chlamydomonas eustigma]